MNVFGRQKNKRMPFRWRKWALRLLLLGFLANIAFIIWAWFSATDYSVTPIEQQIGLALPDGEWAAFSFKLPHKNISYFKVVTHDIAKMHNFVELLCGRRYGIEPLTAQQIAAPPDSVVALIIPSWWQPQTAQSYIAGRCRAPANVFVRFLLDTTHEYTESPQVTLYLESGAEATAIAIFPQWRRLVR